MPVVGIVAALPAEAAAIAAAGTRQHIAGWPVRYRRLQHGTVMCLCSGPGVERAAAAAEVLAGFNPDILVSTGVAGGLAPDLPSGALVIADSVVELSGAPGKQSLRTAWNCGQNRHEAICRLLAREGFTVRSGQVLTSHEPVLGRDAKRALHQQTASLAVDMECAAVAAVSAKAGLPFFALRAVCDTFDQVVPHELYQCLQDDGAINYSRIIKNILSRTLILKELLALGLNHRRALASLKKAWGIIFQNDLFQMTMRRQ